MIRRRHPECPPASAASAGTVAAGIGQVCPGIGCTCVVASFGAAYLAGFMQLGGQLTGTEV